MFESYIFHYIIYASFTVINVAAPKTIYSPETCALSIRISFVEMETIGLILQYLEDKCINQKMLSMKKEQSNKLSIKLVVGTVIMRVSIHSVSPNCRS